ncbi:MAG TPA: DUF1488 family protein [Stellaceae bacterium]|nr:DUF1488 family protein [Stellaceae bacterium]
MFIFPGEPRWDEERDAVAFEVELGEYRGLVLVPRRVLHHALGRKPSPAECVEYLYLHRTAFERIAESKLRARELAPDANVHIAGRDLRRN